MREHGPVTVLDPDEVDDDALIVPTAQMGAPTVVVEKIPQGSEPESALRALEAQLGRSADATMPIECGGINSMIPLLVAARTGLPVVDADGMGRAFPELQMETFSVYGVSGSPMTVAGESQETVVINCGQDNPRMEWLARGITIRLGGVAYIAEYSMTGRQMKETAVPRTLSLALSVGKAISTARGANTDPIEGVRGALAPTLYNQLRILFQGKVTDVERRTVEGFARGRATFSDFTGEHNLQVQFQNENLVAIVDGEVRCVVPDLICVLESDSGEPITTEGLRYGQRVTVIGISTPKMMRTPAALNVFGPQSFGLDYSFEPVESLSERTRKPSLST